MTKMAAMPKHGKNFKKWNLLRNLKSLDLKSVKIKTKLCIHVICMRGEKNEQTRMLVLAFCWAGICF